jgi:hypothetical protein
MLVEAAQKGLKEKLLISLMVEKVTTLGAMGEERNLIVVGGWSRKFWKIVYDCLQLPVLPFGHPLLELYLRESHEKGHGGLDSMVKRSRAKVWILQARRKARKVLWDCFTCKYLAKRCGEQLMGPLPSHQMGLSPPFYAVDLFGPISFVDPNNKRKTGKGWGVVFVCTATSLVHVEMTQSYSTDSFLMALRRFMTLHGAPRRFQSGQGDQLVAALKQVSGWDWAKVGEECSRNKTELDRSGVEWRLVPTGGQHYNKQAERVIGLLKKCLEQSLEGKRCSLEEVGRLLCNAAHIVNSRPISRGKATEDPAERGPITPLHLQLGRETIEVPEANYDLQPRLTRSSM